MIYIEAEELIDKLSSDT